MERCSHENQRLSVQFTAGGGHDLVWCIVSGVQIRSDTTAGLNSDMAAVWESCTEETSGLRRSRISVGKCVARAARTLCVSIRRIFDPFSTGMIRFHLGRAVHSSGKRLEWELL
jgi:hypothetical protein